MSNETNPDEIPVEVLSENETDSSNKIEELDNMDNNDNTSEDLSKLLESVSYTHLTLPTILLV